VVSLEIEEAEMSVAIFARRGTPKHPPVEEVAPEAAGEATPEKKPKRAKRVNK
jgi:hypothetical protein